MDNIGADYFPVKKGRIRGSPQAPDEDLCKGILLDASGIRETRPTALSAGNP